MNMRHETVPCETCLGTGKRMIFLDNQATLPLSVIRKAGQMFEKCFVEESCSNGFVLQLDMKGTYEQMNKQCDDFHKWLRDNYPDEVSHHVVLTVNRIDIKGESKIK